MGENPIITGPGWDFGIYWNVGRAILTGGDPYAVFGSFYPPATTILFALFALVPFAVAYGAWTFGNLIFLARAVGIRKAPVWLFFFPVLFVIAAGQIDLALVALATFLPRKDWKSVAAAALITLKPQFAFLLLPFWLVQWLISDRRRLGAFVGATALVQGWPLLIDPTLYGRWIDRVALYGGGAGRAIASPGVWSLPLSGFFGEWAIASAAGSLVVIAVIAAIRGREWLSRSALVLATPTGHAYDAAALAGSAPAWLLIPLSWLALAAAHAVGSFAPLAAISVAAFVWNAGKVVHETRQGIGKVAGGTAEAAALA